jgi:hypothetical protein
VSSSHLPEKTFFYTFFRFPTRVRKKQRCFNKTPLIEQEQDLDKKGCWLYSMCLGRSYSRSDRIMRHQLCRLQRKRQLVIEENTGRLFADRNCLLVLRVGRSEIQDHSSTQPYTFRSLEVSELRIENRVEYYHSRPSELSG